MIDDDPYAQRIRDLIAATGRDRRVLARLLGYASDNSLRQIERGRAALPYDKAAWLKRYGELRQRLAQQEREWLEKNPAFDFE